jgi:hypothetical protein
MGVSRDRSPTEANDDVRTAEIGGISHSDWDPAEEDWGRGRLMGAPDRHLMGKSSLPWHHLAMAELTPQSLIAELTEAVPAFGVVVDEHLATFGEVIPHVLFGDLTRFVLAARADGDVAAVAAILQRLNAALVAGRPDVVDLIRASFIENVGPWDDQMAAFIASWPDALRAEAERQRNWRRAT